MRANYNLPPGMSRTPEGPPHCETCGGTGQVPLDVVFEDEETKTQQQSTTMRTCPDCNGEGVVSNERDYEE